MRARASCSKFVERVGGKRKTQNVAETAARGARGVREGRSAHRHRSSRAIDKMALQASGAGGAPALVSSVSEEKM